MVEDEDAMDCAKSSLIVVNGEQGNRRLRPLSNRVKPLFLIPGSLFATIIGFMAGGSGDMSPSSWIAACNRALFKSGDLSSQSKAALCLAVLADHAPASWSAVALHRCGTQHRLLTSADMDCGWQLVSTRAMRQPPTGRFGENPITDQLATFALRHSAGGPAHSKTLRAWRTALWSARHVAAFRPKRVDRKPGGTGRHVSQFPAR